MTYGKHGGDDTFYSVANVGVPFFILIYVKSLNIKHIYLPAEEHNHFLKFKINDFWLIHCFRLFNRADKVSREWRLMVIL